MGAWVLACSSGLHFAGRCSREVNVTRVYVANIVAGNRQFFEAHTLLDSLSKSFKPSQVIVCRMELYLKETTHSPTNRTVVLPDLGLACSSCSSGIWVICASHPRLQSTNTTARDYVLRSPQQYEFLVSWILVAFKSSKTWPHLFGSNTLHLRAYKLCWNPKQCQDSLPDCHLY